MKQLAILFMAVVLTAGTAAEEEEADWAYGFRGVDHPRSFRGGKETTTYDESPDMWGVGVMPCSVAVQSHKDSVVYREMLIWTTGFMSAIALAPGTDLRTIPNRMAKQPAPAFIVPLAIDYCEEESENHTPFGVVVKGLLFAIANRNKAKKEAE